MGRSSIFRALRFEIEKLNCKLEWKELIDAGETAASLGDEAVLSEISRLSPDEESSSSALVLGYMIASNLEKLKEMEAEAEGSVSFDALFALSHSDLPLVEWMLSFFPAIEPDILLFPALKNKNSSCLQLVHSLSGGHYFSEEEVIQSVSSDSVETFLYACQHMDPSLRLSPFYFTKFAIISNSNSILDYLQSKGVSLGDISLTGPEIFSLFANCPEIKSLRRSADWGLRGRGFNFETPLLIPSIYPCVDVPIIKDIIATGYILIPDDISSFVLKGGPDLEQRIRFLLPLGLPLSVSLFHRAVTFCSASFLSFLIEQGCPTSSPAYHFLFQRKRVFLSDIRHLISLGVPTLPTRFNEEKMGLDAAALFHADISLLAEIFKENLFGCEIEISLFRFLEAYPIVHSAKLSRLRLLLPLFPTGYPSSLILKFGVLIYQSGELEFEFFDWLCENCPPPSAEDFWREIVSTADEACLDVKANLLVLLNKFDEKLPISSSLRSSLSAELQVKFRLTAGESALYQFLSLPRSEAT